MKILAIDTTGFSASLSLVKDGREVLANKISSGFMPGKNWWDFPYFLPERHGRFLLDNLENVFRVSKIGWKDIDAIAVSAESGIYNCILVGSTLAETLAFCYKKPLIKVDHILAHIYSSWLERNPGDFQFPILVFSASGSHSGFFLESEKECEVIYDAVPEQNKGGVKAFIGIGKIFLETGKKLGIIAPDDSNVNKLIKFASFGNPHRFDFTRYYSNSLLNFDFSDFTESRSQFIDEEKKKTGGRFSVGFIRNVAASFQESITEILSEKIIRLAGDKRAKEIHITGGISEDRYLEKKIKRKIKSGNFPFILRYPIKKEYRLDNAAMIGALAYYQQKYKIKFINFNPKITH